jgi:peptidoglycan/LPS O-acetylase OafA/YrhL
MRPAAAPAELGAAPPSLAARLVQHLTRKTTSGRYIPEIDGLRFVSIALVLLYHEAGYFKFNFPTAYTPSPNADILGVLVATGHHGVELFFMLSGFVLALPFAAHYLAGAHPVRLRAYYLRRVTRLEPPYVLAMIAFFGLRIATDHQGIAALLPHLLASLVYVHDQVFAAQPIINIVAWSLEIEVQFYVLAPLLAGVYLIRHPLVRRGAILAVMLVASALFRPDLEGDRWALSLLNFVQFFLVGFLVADLYVVEWRQAPRPSRRWDVVALLGWPLLLVLWVSDWHTALLFPPLALLLFVAAFRSHMSRWILRNPWLTVLGGMCYSIYLLHYLMISALAHLTGPIGRSPSFAVHMLVQFALLTPIILLVSAVYFVLIERPCMDRDWPRKLQLSFRHLVTARSPSSPSESSGSLPIGWRGPRW